MKVRTPPARRALRNSLLIAIPALPASPPSASPAAAKARQIPGLSGKCLDVAAASSADGTPLQLYERHGTAAQSRDATGNSTDGGAAIQLWDCSASARQPWVVCGAGDIVIPAANKCLDVWHNNSGNGTRLQIWSNTGGESGPSTDPWSATAATPPRCRAGSTSTTGSRRSSGSAPAAPPIADRETLCAR
ncbi:RICIN domain-containing protein [Streptomyces griseorubiginosus]|uniref:RICIN domain-containing protein n=1 Tax=Streptomyces griseorubiginosus TaxID=67304 RepID=UPI0011400CA0|nr:RICIN domain-containing protein [Streptomyces griseorubiginosus]